MKIQEKVRGLLQAVLDADGRTYERVEREPVDDRMSVQVSELDLVSLFALLAGLQGTGCLATVVPWESGSEDWGVSRGLSVVVRLPDDWWRE